MNELEKEVNILRARVVGLEYEVGTLSTAVEGLARALDKVVTILEKIS